MSCHFDTVEASTRLQQSTLVAELVGSGGGCALCLMPLVSRDKVVLHCLIVTYSCLGYFWLKDLTGAVLLCFGREQDLKRLPWLCPSLRKTGQWEGRHCVQSFGKSKDEAKVLAHHTHTIEDYEEQLCNTVTRIYAVQNMVPSWLGPLL